MSKGEGSIFDTIRSRTAQVMEQARFVRIDPAGLEAFAPTLAELARDPLDPDPEHHFTGEASAVLAYHVCLGTINFGSGWFPRLRKRPGCSGYFTIAGGLADQFRANGPWDARALCALETLDCTHVFAQDPHDPEVGELMTHFAAALRELGEWLLRRHAGRFESLVEAAEGSAERWVTLLAELPMYRDVAHYGDFEVPFYKRAQLTCADLALVFAGEGFGAFHDLDQLTIFADNLVPHVLRHEGVLEVDAGLVARIDAGELIPAGSPEEVELRAAAVHAVEQLVAILSTSEPRIASANPMTARVLDYLLWYRGQRPEIKARPRHRTRSIYY